MAENQGGDQDDEKTEEPSQRKLDDAKKKGQVPLSKDLSHWMVLTGGVAVIAIFSSPISAEVAALARLYLGQAHQLPVDAVSLQSFFADMAGSLGFVLAVPAVLMIVAALIGTLLQAGLPVAAKNIQPQAGRISPMAGFKRLFSIRSVVEFIKGILKVSMVGAAAVMASAPSLPLFKILPQMEFAAFLQALFSLVLKVSLAILMVLALIAAADTLYQRLQFLRNMRMSRRELKDEHKQSEGDPMIKGRMKQLRQERARRRMMAAVPKASVVITNPTHFAVALMYDPASPVAAPICVAKGADKIAFKIREIAKENGVAIVENPPLARALFASVDLDEEIPREHFQAVAEIIAFVFKQRSKAGRPGS